MKFHCCFSFLRKFADIAVSFERIFVDISLPRKLNSSIFLCPKRNFAQSFEFSPTSAKFRMSNVRNFKRKFAKFSRNFDENKARISPKFAPITFAQYCNRYRQPNSLTTKLLQLQLIKLTYLTNFFLSIFIASNTTPLRTEAYTLLEDVIADLICQESDVLKYVLSLNTNKACSPDGVTAG